LYLYPPKPRREPVVRVVLGGREINRWRFEHVFLWELDARETLRQGVPGFLALVPLMRGGADMAAVVESARRIKQAFPQDPQPVAEDVLLALAGGFYNFEKLARVFGRDRMRQSSLYVEGKAEGKAEGKVEGIAEGRAEGKVEGNAEGRLDEKRESCLALTRKYHSLVFERVRPVIEACEDRARLQHWLLMAPD
jgi:predicted transposase YdaD